MKNNLKYILLFCFIFWIQAVESKADFQYGLTFKSYEVEKEERTGLDLTSEGLFSFPDGFILEFYVHFRRIQHNFGYVFRIVGEGNEYIDLLLSRTRNSYILEPQLTAIYKSGQILSNTLFEEINADFEQWIKVKLTVDRKKGVFKLALNEKEFEKNDDYFKKLQNVHIAFGKNDLLSFETSDVPPMSVRDITIRNINEKPIYYWKLSQHVHNGVYDEHKQHFALSKSPKWILDSHTYWQADTTFVTGIYPQIVFNEKNNEIAIADASSFYIYQLNNRFLDIHRNVTGAPLGSKSNQLSYNSLNDNYFTYNFVDKIASYNVQAQGWDNLNTDEDIDNPHYWHHNRYFSPVNNTFYTFGGYGFHLYKNDIYKYHFSSNTWEKGTFKGEIIAPRYLAGLGAFNNKEVLIFGGYGSEGGSQELSPRNYYELYSYNLETSVAKKKWELNAKAHNFVMANSLVIDTLNNCFYALCFPHQKFNTSLELYRFAIDEPTYEILADSIPYLFSDIYSYADLYLSNDEKKLVAITSYTDLKNSKASISIYTLAFPPLNAADLYQQEPKTGRSWIFISITLLVLVVLFLFIRKIRKKESVNHSKEKTVEQVQLDKKVMTSDPILGIKPLNEQHIKQSILLFGGFQVLDKGANNITGEFTPTLKQLFLLILLYTLKDGKGISSVKLREILWFDKSNESAKNNRGVSLSKLRAIFEKIGGISISNTNSYWTVEFDKDIYCDYYEALMLMTRIYKEVDPKDVNRLIAIVSAGEMLPNLQAEWVDTFKSDFSNRLIDLLLYLIEYASALKLASTTIINIADAIFAHDSLNEDALKVKCTLLVEMGKNGLAQKIYASFIKEYQSLFGVDFKYTFEQIIS